MPPRCAVFYESLLLAALLLNAAAGQATQPAPADYASPAPTTRESGPRAAYVTFLEAIDKGDGDALRASLHASNPSEQQVVDAIADWVQAYGRLQQATTRAFGAAASRVLMPDPVGTQQAINVARSASEQFDNNRAVVHVPDGGPDVVLQQVDGQWKIPLAEVARKYSPEEIAQSVTEYGREARLMDQITAEIAADRYHNADEAVQVLRARMMRPTTDEAAFDGPTTHPVGPTSRP